MNPQDTIAQFRKSLSVELCIKANVKQLIGLYGKSSGGKSVTALIWAMATTAGKSKIGAIDTENKRLGMAADLAQQMAKQRYGSAPEVVVINLQPPFHPLKYVAAIQELQDTGCGAVVIDSASHAWSGEGGYLDLKEEELSRMAGDDWKKREKCAMAAAARVKPHTHARLVNCILQTKMSIYMCFRAAEKTHMGKDRDGRTEIVRDDFSTPIQEGNLIFEMLIAGEIMARDGKGGFCSFVGPGRKYTHPDLLSILPKEGEQFTFAHGEAVAEWCRGGKATASTPPPTSDRVKSMLELYQLTAKIHGVTKGATAEQKAEGAARLQQHLWDEDLLDMDRESLSDVSAERLAEIVARIKAKG